MPETVQTLKYENWLTFFWDYDCNNNNNKKYDTTFLKQSKNLALFILFY